MKLLFFIGVVAVGGFLPSTMAGFIGKGKDLLGSGVDIATGVAKSIPDYLEPKQIFDLGKQGLLGYPVEVIASAINTICSAAQNSGSIKSQVTPELSRMAFQLMTSCKNYSYPIDQADKMWANPDFDPKKKTVLLATGWTTTINETGTIYDISRAYFCRGDVNFIAVDAANYVDTLYSWAALNTEEIGSIVGKGLSLLKGKVPSNKIHLIGHSLGAHIVGSAGRTYYELTGEYIGRITGLDPAKPCFNEGEQLTGLSRGDALYVDIIHSNPGNLGKREPIGDSDFYPGGLDPLIKGCVHMICAHARAWELYAESVYPGNEENFMSAKCNSQNQLTRGKCGELNVPMGYVDKHFNTKGNFFLEVNGKAPFGKKQGKQVDEKCGACPALE